MNFPHLSNRIEIIIVAESELFQYIDVFSKQTLFFNDLT